MSQSYSTNWEKKFRNAGKVGVPSMKWSSRFTGASSFGAEFAGSGGRATRDSVTDSFYKTQMQWEGYVANMYSDPIGLITTGVGNLIDGNSIANPMASSTAYALALQLPWVHKSDGQPATQAEIIQDWQTVKAARVASGHRDLPNDARITQLKLMPDAIKDLVYSKMLDHEKELVKSLPNFANFPADAQMAIHGMAWAMGSAFIPVDHFTQFASAANSQNWLAAKAQSGFQNEAPQRKVAQDLMFDNAAKAVANNLNFETFWYPGVAPDVAPPPPSKMPLILATVALAGAAGGVYYYRDDVIPFARSVVRDTVKMTNRYVVNPVVGLVKKA